MISCPWNWRPPNGGWVYITISVLSPISIILSRSTGKPCYQCEPKTSSTLKRLQNYMNGNQKCLNIFEYSDTYEFSLTPKPIFFNSVQKLLKRTVIVGLASSSHHLLYNSSVGFVKDATEDYQESRNINFVSAAFKIRWIANSLSLLSLICSPFKSSVSDLWRNTTNFRFKEEA